MNTELNNVNQYYASLEYGLLYLYGSIMYFTLPTARYLLSQPFTMNKIIDHLYISDFSSACDINKLHENGITHIITIIPGVGPMYPNEFTYFIIDIVDRPYSDIEIYFDDTNDFIENAINNNGNVLIHCKKGISRSATIAIAYLIKKKGYTLSTALQQMKEARNCINPNKGFMKQLHNYELKQQNNNDNTTNKNN